MVSQKTGAHRDRRRRAQFTGG